MFHLVQDPDRSEHCYMLVDVAHNDIAIYRMPNRICWITLQDILTSDFYATPADSNVQPLAWIKNFKLIITAKTLDDLRSKLLLSPELFI